MQEWHEYTLLCSSLAFLNTKYHLTLNPILTVTHNKVSYLKIPILEECVMTTFSFVK